MRRIRILYVLLVVGLCLYAAPVLAVPVDAELLLLVDTSGSISDSEYNLQKGGYVAAFQNAAIQAAIASRPNGIAVAYAEWSSAGAQSLPVGWTKLTNASEANAFAAAINAVTRSFTGLTAPGSAIAWGAPLILSNEFEGNRLTIDVSGDGSENDGANTLAARNAAAALGIVINGLPILGSETSLDTWYLNNIVTPGGFLQVATDFDAFENAVTSKIGREIIGGQVPEPTTMLLLGSGLIGLAGYARKRFKR